MECIVAKLLSKLNLKILMFLHNEEAQDLVEYALLVTLIALAAVSGINKLASSVNAVFSRISNTLS